MIETTVVEYKEVTAESPVMIVGLPGIGLVGKLVADHMIIELKAEKRSEEKESGRRQSTYSVFHRYLALPERVLSEKVDGTMKNGILELRLPKSEPKPKDNSRRVRLN